MIGRRKTEEAYRSGVPGKQMHGLAALVFMAGCALGLTGCHGSKGLSAFEIPE